MSEHLLIKVREGKASEALAAMEKIYKKYLPDSPFQFSFADEDIARQYRDDKHWLENFAYRIHISWWMFLVAGATAIFIAMATVSFQAR